MKNDFIPVAAMMIAIGVVGIWGASVTHPIMYINVAVIFGFVGYFGWQSLKE